MKKVSHKEKQWMIKTQKKSIKKIFLFNQKKNRLKRKKGKKCSAWWDKSIDAPEIFSILNKKYRDGYLLFLKDIEEAIKSNFKTIRLNFKNTRIITSDAGILLRANLTTLALKQPKLTRIKCAPSRNQKINEVLTQIRILELFNQDFHITPQSEDVIHWNLAEGHGADGEKYEEILGSYDGTLTPKLSEGFYLGLTEAMTNTRQHAYPNNSPRHPDIPEWWMFSQEKDGRLSVVFFDLGIGIPGSLPKKQPKLWQKLREVLTESDGDAEIIAGTIKYKKSSTEQEHRGKGLTQLEDVINGVENAVLYIYSNKGCYAIERDGKKSLINFDVSINGTLIYWSVPI